jgi:L-ascorbate metabolism protein UlaG (beta-lactamase superfamily)
MYSSAMKTAFLKDGAFLSDVHGAPAGRFLLMDPYLSDSLTRKYAGTDTPHVRMSERVVDPARLGFVSVVTCSHVHTDHMDPETIRALLAANPGMEVVIPEAIRDIAAERLGIGRSRPLGMNDGITREAGGFTLQALPSAHDVLEADDAGNFRCLGYVVRAGAWRLYHSGDTRLYDGLAERLAGFDLDLGLLPINGWSPGRRVKGNLDIDESIALGLAAGMRLVVPHHFDMFEFNTADVGAFRAAAGRRGLPVRVLRLGERLTLGGNGPAAESDTPVSGA